MKKWKDFINEARTSQGVLDMINRGPQRKGSYPPRMPAKRTKSAPPGAPGGGSIGHGSLEEDIDPETFEKKQELEPNIWGEGQESLEQGLRDRLLTIAQDFIDGLEIQVPVLDIRLTGSIANYNWSDYSDIDLHIVVDYSKLDSDPVIVKKFFDASRLRWNDKHDIKLYGYEVEIYVEDSSEEHRSSGIYSIPSGEWIIEPDIEDTNIDHVTARKKSDDILTQISLIQMTLNKKPKAALRSIRRLKAKISNMRQRGLDSRAQEYSSGNIAFKILRREGALDTLSNLKDRAYDAAFSIGKSNEVL
tara:strand:+ start:604 stop:1515 length:912 start_codon:yes stop_codon:yes gene_type:complete